EGEDAVQAVVADVQAAPAHRAALVLNGQHTPCESRVGRPAIAHGTLRGKSDNHGPSYIPQRRAALAFRRAVVFSRHVCTNPGRTGHAAKQTQPSHVCTSW